MTSALRLGLPGQDGVCFARVHDLHQGATVHAEGGRECRGLVCVALKLSLFVAAVAPSDLLHPQEVARGLVDVHDAVSAGCVLVHQPAQLVGRPVRVGVLLLRTVELFQALGGLLAAQAHAMQELIDPSLAGADVEPLCVEPVVHQALDRHSAGAQDVGHSQDVLV